MDGIGDAPRSPVAVAVATAAFGLMRDWGPSATAVSWFSASGKPAWAWAAAHDASASDQALARD